VVERVVAFVGRERELGRLRTLADAVAGGESGALAVVGPAGVGKSALLERFVDGLDALTVLRAAGVEAERDMPFAALDALLRPVLDRREALPAVQAEALERALALAPGEPPDQFAVGAATLSLLGAAAEDRGVLCLVDDAHWVDPSSLRALAFAARRLGSESVGVIVAARDEALPPELRGLEQLRVAGLEDEHAHELLAALGGDRLPADVAAQLVAAADGNPLVLQELVERLDPAQLEGREALVGPPPPHARAEDLLGERLSALPEPARDALLVAATAGGGEIALVERALAAYVPPPASVAVAPTAPGPGATAAHGALGIDALAPAEAAGLVELGSGRLEFRHPLVASVAYHLATPAARRAAHAAVAAVLDPEDPRRPWHLAAAATGPDEEVAAALERLAGDARRRGGYPSAARAERRAADLTPENERRARRLLAAAADLELAGLNADAVEAIDQAATLTCSAATAARVRGMRAHHLLIAGDPAAARGELQAAADGLAPADPVTAAAFLLECGWACMLRGHLDHWRERTEQAAALLAPGHTDTATHRVARAMHASALVAVGRADEAEPILAEVEQSLLRLAREHEPITGAVETYGLMIHSLVWLERWIAADRLLALLVEDARHLAAASALPYLLSVRTVLDLRLGRWSSAAAAADEAVGLAEAAGHEAFRAGGLGLRAVAHALRGDHERAEADAAEAIAAGERAAPRLAIDPHHALGLVALGRGDVEAATEHLREAARIHDRAGFQEPGSRPFQADLIEALIRAGETGEATERLEAWERVAEKTGRPFARATAARCRAMLAPDDEIDEAFAAALALHDDLPLPFERARTQLVHGERLRRARRRADARGPLRDALATFDALPAPDWAAKARHELRATGGMVPPRERPGTTELTPHELQVALMVAEGRTNREVAAALFLAPKTIEHHLSTIFRKLGIRRRTELAHALAGSGQT
jgi:DNA-binding CsgD family transcriptional regulator